MRVVVCGAGIGGLTLAQGLRAQGHDVVVLERDRDLADTGGYRLHLDDDACGVLRRVLPEPVHRAVLASAAGPEAMRAFHVTDRLLRPLLVERYDTGEDRLMIGRVPLRVLLGHGLDDVLRLGVTVSAVERGAVGPVVVCHDGGRHPCDLVVAADGARSVLAEQLSGRPASSPTGLVGAAGRTPASPGLDAWAPGMLARGPLLAVGPRGVGLFLTRHDPRQGAVHISRCVDPPAVVEEATYVWGVILSADRAPTTRCDSAAALKGWSPWAREVVGRSDPSSLGTYRFLAADPSGSGVRWGAGAVAGLGDAVHAMPPTGGQSAATAVLDAADLLDTLEAVGTDLGALPDALARYHDLVWRRGRQRVSESLVPARWVRRTAHPAATPLVLAGAAAGVRVRRLLDRVAS